MLLELTNRIAIIVEGENREQLIFENLNKIFFSNAEIVPLVLSAGENIYMLWKQLAEDDFETDIIEIIRDYNAEVKEQLQNYSREDFSEIYLFFDLDLQHNDLTLNKESVLNEMLDAFNNETENGKLYISYPMIEAVRDYIPDRCDAATHCIWSLKNISNYKNESGLKSPNPAVSRYSYNDWHDVINVFGMRIACLFSLDKVPSFDYYRFNISPKTIYNKEKTYVPNQLFVLSALPEFLLDYFPKKFWTANVKNRDKKYDKCILM